MFVKCDSLYQTEFIWSVKVCRIEITFFRSGMKSLGIAYFGLVLLSNRIAKISACAFKFSESKPPIPVAARFKAWVCSRSLGGITGSNPAGDMMSVVSVVCCAGRGLCDGPVPFPPGESHSVCVCVCH